MSEEYMYEEQPAHHRRSIRNLHSGFFTPRTRRSEDSSICLEESYDDKREKEEERYEHEDYVDSKRHYGGFTFRSNRHRGMDRYSENEGVEESRVSHEKAEMHHTDRYKKPTPRCATCARYEECFSERHHGHMEEHIDECPTPIKLIEEVETPQEMEHMEEPMRKRKRLRRRRNLKRSRHLKRRHSRW